MSRFRCGAPAHPRWGCAGVLFLALLAGACRGDTVEREEPVTLELDGGTVQLAPGVRVIEIEIARANAGREFDPADTDARTGNVVRFIARDRRNHVIAFDAETLEPAAAAFLEATAQMSGPPLLHDGASWVVSLDGAPQGTYSYVCLTHGDRGSITVSPSQ